MSGVLIVAEAPRSAGEYRRAWVRRLYPSYVRRYQRLIARACARVGGESATLLAGREFVEEDELPVSVARRYYDEETLRAEDSLAQRARELFDAWWPAKNVEPDLTADGVWLPDVMSVGKPLLLRLEVVEFAAILERVLDDRAAVDDHVVADDDAGSKHGAREHHAAGAQTGRRRQRGARMDERRQCQPQRPQPLEELDTPPEGGVADADDGAVDRVPRHAGRKIVVAPDDVRPRVGSRALDEARKGPARRRRDVGDGAAVPARAHDEEAARHGSLYCLVRGMGARPCRSTSSASRKSHSVSMLTDASNPRTMARLSAPRTRPSVIRTSYRVTYTAPDGW